MCKHVSRVLAALLLAVLAATGTAQQMAAVPVEYQVALNAYQGLVEEHVLGALRTAKAAASSQEARSLQWPQIKPLLDEFSADLGTDATIWFLLPDGRYYSTATGGLAEQSLEDRDYFPALMRGEDVVGELVISRATGLRSVIIATPVKEGDEVVAAIGVSMQVVLLSQLVEANTRLPADMYFYALERSTKIALHRNSDRMFSTPAEVGDEALGEAFAAALVNDRGNFAYTLAGRQISSIYQKSAVLNWYFFLARINE
jgi:methyl-accepting chemotaxis protein